MSKIKKTIFIFGFIFISNISASPITRMALRAIATFSKREASILRDALEFITELKRGVFHPGIFSTIQNLQENLIEKKIILSSQQKKDLKYYFDKLSTLDLNNKSLDGKSLTDLFLEIRILNYYFNKKHSQHTKKTPFEKVNKEIKNLFKLIEDYTRENLDLEIYDLCSPKTSKKLNLNHDQKTVFQNFKELCLDAQTKLIDVKNTEDDKFSIELQYLERESSSILSTIKMILGEEEANTLEEITESETA